MNDEGEWLIYGFPEKVYLMSDDFTHDVRINIDGDFSNIREKLEYAKNIAERLNKTKG